jgi:hypothetical protein
MYDDAFVHLQQGLSLIKVFKAADVQSRNSPVSGSSNYIETSLSDAMLRLHIQSAFFGTDASDPQISGFRSDDDEDFGSIGEARGDLDRVFLPVSQFMDTVRNLASEGGPPDSGITRPDVAQMQFNLRIELARHLHRLNRLESQVQDSLDQKSQRAIDLIRLHHKTFSVVAETYIDIEYSTCDLHIDEFRELVILSERIANSFGEQSNNTCTNNALSSRPSLLLDMGILPSLLYVCLACPSVDVRRQALRCLQAWPHREGPWDSNLVALMGSLILQVETEAEIQRVSSTATTVTSIQDITYISPASRIICVNMTMDDDQKTAILRYNTKECNRGMPQLERRVLVDEVILL